MKKLDRYVLAFAVVGLAYFALVIGLSLANAYPGGGR